MAISVFSVIASPICVGGQDDTALSAFLASLWKAETRSDVISKEDTVAIADECSKARAIPPPMSPIPTTAALIGLLLIKGSLFRRLLDEALADVSAVSLFLPPPSSSPPTILMLSRRTLTRR